MVKESNMTVREIYTWLEEVTDPEIPVLSLVDLGVITRVELNGDEGIVDMTPTFVGCPALEMMRESTKEVLTKHGVKKVAVNVSFKEAWTSDRISEKGKTALKKFGIAPPSSSQLFTDLDILESAHCPRCDGDHTQLRSPFGPTLCRAIYYCLDCQEAFEQFKPL
jgi:ring-1,2-phenylacetyl-CoA epoxidase subunit PaaD